eukprot:12418586-Karenia_brevis.AAC.1
MDKKLVASLGRKSYVSKSALATVLAELHEKGVLPEAASFSRASIKRARDDDINIETRYGPLFRTLQTDDKRFTIHYVHPLALIAHMVLTFRSFAQFFLRILQKKPVGPNSPWHIVMYTDEVVPGNLLASNNERKMNAVYWTFSEFGSESLGNENLWFVLTVLRSNIVSNIQGGMSE